MLQNKTWGGAGEESVYGIPPLKLVGIQLVFWFLD